MRLTPSNINPDSLPAHESKSRNVQIPLTFNS
uniref:Uncharacterized protein n=1 Tax=Rhizophora mucronata TaxID=61149 RepID=A0A2P2Q9S5_RHIMU